MKRQRPFASRKGEAKLPDPAMPRHEAQARQWKRENSARAAAIAKHTQRKNIRQAIRTVGPPYHPLMSVTNKQRRDSLIARYVLRIVGV